jgi:pyruvate dehydrogenase E2 component (dihydrolipoamide acetyltransferase)
VPTHLKLPELGENIEGGDVLRVLVAVGDRVKADQPVFELETDKATIEVPASIQGIVREVTIKAGDKVKVGQVILVVDETPAAGAFGAPSRALLSRESPDGRDVSAGPAAAPGPDSRIEGGTAPADRPQRGGAGVPAAPSARRLARELGVDIGDVRGSGPGGRISMDDVAAHAGRLLAAQTGRSRVAALPDFSAWGDIERQPMTPVRRATARQVSQAWTTIPHVTQHDRADITNADALRRRLAHEAGEKGVTLTVTAFALKAVASALTAFPQLNASVDMAAEEIICKKYLNIGIAVDTDRGLLVPVIRDVGSKSIVQLAQELTQVAEGARARRLTLDQMQGGSFTITNLGSLGGTQFSPIINWPEVAILGLSRASMEPVHVAGRFEPRLMLPLSLSYDHRAVDGADAVRFLRRVVEGLEAPALLE